MITINKPRILIYDNENMIYLTGFYGSLDISYETDDYTTLYDESIRVIDKTIFTCEIDDTKRLDNVKLDPTTMERIAKFNKEQEIRRLDEKIKEKKEKIKELDDILQDKDKRVQKLKEFVANIYNIDVNDSEQDYEDDDFYY